MTLLKTIAACLVLANVGYFLWNRGIAQPADAALANAPQSLTLASESAPVPRPPDEVSHLAPAGPPPETHEEGSAALLTNVKRCVSVGPFRDVSEAARAASTLRGGGYDPRQRIADGEVWAGVWVYLPLPASKTAAELMHERLTGGGIDDALEMPGPNDTSVISLGLFSDPKRAQARVAQAQAMQLNPAITDRKRNGNVYWIDVDLKSTDSLLNPADLQGESGHIMRLEVKGCPSVGGSK